MNGNPSPACRVASFHTLKLALGCLASRPFASAYDARGLGLRMAADLLLANVGFFWGYLATVLYHTARHPTSDSIGWVWDLLVSGWLAHVPLFSAAWLVAVTAGGLYRVRPRRGLRHDVAASLRAATLAYLLCVCLVFLWRQVGRAFLPGSAALAGWTFSSLLVAGTRAGKRLVSDAYIIEPRLGRKAHRAEYVLLIGGAGYIGSVLARRLLAARYHVRVLDNLTFGDAAIRDLYPHPRFELLPGDFRAVEPVVRAVHGTDAVIHLGAIVGDPACALDRELTLSVNLHGVRMLRDVCCGYGVRRLLFASTCSVYGACAGLIDEQSPLAPVSLYAQSKIDAERVLLEDPRDGFHPTVLRLATAFGLSPRMRFDLVVNLLAARAVTRGAITIFNGHQWRPFIHTDDIARAFLACLEAPPDKVSGQVFNAGDDRLNHTLRELGETVARLVPGTEVRHEENSADPRSYRVDFSRISRVLGFRCLTSLEQGIAQTAEALRTGRFPSFEDGVYHNAAFMKGGGGRLLTGVSLPAGLQVGAGDAGVPGVPGPHADFIRRAAYQRD